MSFFDDFASALHDYTFANVTLDFVNVIGPTPPDVNINEVWWFQVKVTNKGHLNMTNVTLLIEGVNGTTVGTSINGPWLTGFVTTNHLTVNGGGGSANTEVLYFKAPGTTKPPHTTLVNARVDSWDADLTRLLITETGFANKFSHYDSAVL